jgi:hypothetical protein
MSTDNFQIYINSTKGTGSVTTNLTYTFDFTAFKKGDYEMSFVFVSDGSNDMDTSNPALLFINFSTTNVYQCLSSIQAAVKSDFIGVLLPDVMTSTSGRLKANTNDNLPIYIRLPVSNTFNIQILDYNGNLFVDSNSNTLVEYILILNFKKIN